MTTTKNRTRNTATMGRGVMVHINEWGSDSDPLYDAGTNLAVTEIRPCVPTPNRVQVTKLTRLLTRIALSSDLANKLEGGLT